MRFMVQLRAFDNDGELVADNIIICLDKGSDHLCQLARSHGGYQEPFVIGIEKPRKMLDQKTHLRSSNIS